MWEEQWLYVYRDHSEPDGGGEWRGRGVGGEGLEDYNEDSDEKEVVHLLMCCSGKRPRKSSQHNSESCCRGGRFRHGS